MLYSFSLGLISFILGISSILFGCFCFYVLHDLENKILKLCFFILISLIIFVGIIFVLGGRDMLLDWYEDFSLSPYSFSGLRIF